MDSIRVRSRLRSMVPVFALLVALFAVAASPHQAAAQDSSVSIVDFAFDSAAVTVEAGSTVTWTNDGDAPHTATAGDGTFDSGNLDPGESFSFTFDTPGTYAYSCSIHPNMTGTITVTAAGDDAADDDAAATDDATADDTAADTTEDDAADTDTTTTAPTTGVGPMGEAAVETWLIVAAVIALAGFFVIRRRTA